MTVMTEEGLLGQVLLILETDTQKVPHPESTCSLGTLSVRGWVEQAGVWQL